MSGTESEKKNDSATARPSLGFTLPFADKAPASPVEFMTAATAAGLAVGAQFANVFFGMMQATLDAANKSPASSDYGVKKEAAPDVTPSQADDADAAVAGVQAVEPAATQAKAKKVSPRKAKVAKPNVVQTAQGSKTSAGEVARQKRKAAVRKRLQAGDDLKKISGIGPKLESLLNGMGISRYSDIAGWSDKDVEHIDRELGLDGRVNKDGWIAQAKALLR